MQSGLGNLEVNESEPIRPFPLLIKPINGDYQTAQSKAIIILQHQLNSLQIANHHWNNIMTKMK